MFFNISCWYLFKGKKCSFSLEYLPFLYSFGKYFCGVLEKSELRTLTYGILIIWTVFLFKLRISLSSQKKSFSQVVFELMRFLFHNFNFQDSKCRHLCTSYINERIFLWIFGLSFRLRVSKDKFFVNFFFAVIEWSKKELFPTHKWDDHNVILTFHISHFSWKIHIQSFFIEMLIFLRCFVTL